MRLVLMEDLHIQPSEIDKLDKKIQWQYYYFCIARRKVENEETKKPLSERTGKPTRTMHFPDDFVSQIENKIVLKNLEDKNIK